jgi:hypothetical protein
MKRFGFALLLFAACKAPPYKLISSDGTEPMVGSASAPPGFILPEPAPRDAWGGRYVDPRLPASAPMSFSGRESTMGGPEIVYPLDGSLHPTNLLDITIQWRRGDSGQNLFRLRFQNRVGTFDLFVPCTVDECVFPVPEQSWRQIAGVNRDRDVTLTITAAGNPSGVDLVSPPSTLHFSPARVDGGLYYWSTSLQGTYRLLLGEKKAVPFITPAADGCYGCHAVSRNGKRIAWTDMSAPDPDMPTFRPRHLRAAPTDRPNEHTGGSTPSTTMTISPDGSKVLVSDGAGGLTLRDADTAAVITTVPPSLFGTGKGAFFPEWSPDGKNIAVTLGPADSVFSLRFNLPRAEIAVLPYNDGQFGQATVLVPQDRDIHFYPSWSPDGKWIVFCSAPADPSGAGGNYDNPQSRLRLVAASGGRIYELERATQGTGTTASWPKFTPFAQLDGQLLFIAFSSKLEYGFLKSSRAIPQLWLAAVDLRLLDAGDPSAPATPPTADSSDPSWAPVWLPFQEVDQNNHLPFWTESLGCTQDADCGEAAICRDGGCVPKIVID